MAEDEEDPRRRFRLIDGLPEKPRPREASWPRRYQVVRRRRSVRRPRSGPCKPQRLEELGVLVRETRPGSSRRRPNRKKWGAPPWRMEQRKVRDRLRMATQEEFDQMVREALDTVMDLRSQFPLCGGCIDPDGTSWGGPPPLVERTRYKPIEKMRIPHSWDEVKAGQKCQIICLPGEYLIESVGERNGRRFATLVDELGARREIWILELLDLGEETTAEEARESLIRRLLGEARDRGLGWGIDPDG